jgi:hypothetical protein
MIEIDVDHQVKVVQRTVGTRAIDTGEAHVITVSQSYDTGPADRWGLAIHLSAGEFIDPSFGQQWTGTEDGRRFLTLSGEEPWPIDASRPTWARN